MSAHQQETIKRLRTAIAELKRYKKQAIALMKRNDELLKMVQKKKSLGG